MSETATTTTASKKKAQPTTTKELGALVASAPASTTASEALEWLQLLAEGASKVSLELAHEVLNAPEVSTSPVYISLIYAIIHSSTAGPKKVEVPE